MESRKERRQAKRYSVQCGAIVYLKKKPLFLTGSSRYIQLGPLCDISSQGMSMHYFFEKDFPDVSSGLAIRTTSGKIIIDDVKFETVYDVELAEMPDGKQIRKRAIKLVELSGYQSAWLACLIHNLRSRQSELPDLSGNDERPEILREVF